jgi:hypothetical protein
LHWATRKLPGQRGGAACGAYGKECPLVILKDFSSNFIQPNKIASQSFPKLWVDAGYWKNYNIIEATKEIKNYE